MLRVNVRSKLKDFPLEDVIQKVEQFIAINPDKERYLAGIDLLRLYGKSRCSKRFYRQALYLCCSINNPDVYREIARFAYFIEEDNDRARHYARKALEANENEPLWVYYIARKERTYFEKLCDGVYLTAIPKNASTSLKSMILEEVHKNNSKNPHAAFGNPFYETIQLDGEITEGDLKLISIREPLTRFISYYNKNITEELSLKEELGFTEKNNEYGLSLVPALDDFVANLGVYCYMFNDVLHHVLPQTAYFSDLSIYDGIADINDVEILGELVSDKLKLDKKISPKRRMVSKRPVKNMDISSEVKKSVLRLFCDDIKMYETGQSNKSYSFEFGTS